MSMPMMFFSSSAVLAGRGIPLFLGTEHEGDGRPPGKTGPNSPGAAAGNLRSSPSNSTHWTDGDTEAQHIHNQDQSPPSTSCLQGPDQPADFQGRGHLGLRAVCVHGQVPGTGTVPGQQAHNFASARAWVQPAGPAPAQGLGGAITTGQRQGPGRALALPPLLSRRPTYQRGLQAQCVGRALRAGCRPQRPSSPGPQPPHGDTATPGRPC